MTRMQQSAQWYAKNGLDVFPLHSVQGGACTCGDPDCQTNAGKHPLCSHGFKDATTNLRTIADWWTRWPNANIGIPTGVPSGLLVLDCDPRNGGPEDRSDLIERFGPIPDTAEAISGSGGRHYFFHYTGPVPPAIAKGVDLKCDGGYVVVAPSVHLSGKAYQWDGVRGCKAILNPADPPAWLLESIAASRNGNGAGHHAGADSAAKSRIPKGQRNQTLASRAGTIRRCGMSQEAIEAALLAENRIRCDPPLPETEVKRIARSIGSYPPGDTGEQEHASEEESADAGRLITVRADAVQITPVSWFWPGRIACGKLNVVAGDPSNGKSTVAIDMAAKITGKPGRFGLRLWPDGTHCDVTGSALILSAEDDPEDTLCPRLQAAGADLTRVHIVKSVLTGYTGEGEPGEKLFSLQKDLCYLDQKLTELGDVRLLVIDPVTAYLDAVDSHKNSEVRGVLAPLKTLAHKHGVAVVLVSHLNKDNARALMSVSGSLAFVAAARTVYLVVEDPLDPEHRRRLLLGVKNNLGAIPAGLGYRVESATVACTGGFTETARIAWDTTPVEMTAQEALRLSRKESPDEELGPKERAVIELLENEPDLKPAAIATQLGWNPNATRQILHRLCNKGKVKSHHGAYRLTDPVRT